MIAFVDMAHDRRTYRFYQDTSNGRLLIAESQAVDKIAAAVANYIARRLVERERALASDVPCGRMCRSEPGAPGRSPRQAIRQRPAIDEGEAKARPRQSAGTGAEKRFTKQLGDALSLFLMMLGSITLALVVGLGVYLAWTMRLRTLWAQFIGAPPF